MESIKTGPDAVVLLPGLLDLFELSTAAGNRPWKELVLELQVSSLVVHATVFDQVTNVALPQEPLKKSKEGTLDANLCAAVRNCQYFKVGDSADGLYLL